MEAKKAGLPVPGLPIPAPESVTPPWERYDPRSELKCRALALPLALLLGRWAAGGNLMAVLGSLFAMVVHENGHAITAWLAGHWAVPTFGFTRWGPERHWWIVLGVAGGLAFGGYKAWKAQRWGLVCAAAAVLLLQLIIQGQSRSTQEALIVFGGDGGALVLATVLMAMFYAPHKSAFYKNWGMRWALLVIGALAFMSVYHTWSGPWENIPFGEVEGVNLSDPTLLTETYGWSVIQLVGRYLLLARLCFAALLTLYVGGLVSAYWQTQSKTPQR